MAGDAARESSIERQLTLAVSPAGRLRLLESPDVSPLDPTPAAAIRAAFAGGTAAGLFHLSAAEVSTQLPPVLGFFQDFARLFVARLCGIGDIDRVSEPDRSRMAAQPPVDRSPRAGA